MRPVSLKSLAIKRKLSTVEASGLSARKITLEIPQNAETARWIPGIYIPRKAYARGEIMQPKFS